MPRQRRNFFDDLIILLQKTCLNIQFGMMSIIKIKNNDIFHDIIMKFYRQ
jgi:hypothetical protein